MNQSINYILHIIGCTFMLSAVVNVENVSANVGPRESKRGNIYGPKWNLSPNRRCTFLLI